VRVLLDTHILLWWLAADPSLPGSAHTAIADRENTIFVSAASAWEISVKQAAGRLDAPDDLVAALEVSEFEGLPITTAHAEAAGRLPPHHADPFDRMLIAQARQERLTILTVDAKFAEYDVPVLSLA